MHGAMTRGAGAMHEGCVQIALGWLARLPLLTEAQLGVLLGVDEWDARAVSSELRRRGMSGSVMVDSPEFDAALRLSYLTDRGVAALARVTNMSLATLTDRVPVARTELLARLARLETAVGIADTVAMLADDLRRRSATADGTGMVLDDAGTTRWASHRGQLSGMPPAIEGWGQVRVGSMRASFLLAWDRAGAPRAHRRDRVAAWYRSDDASGAPWGPALPPVLIVCPDERIVAQWLDLLDASAARRNRTFLRVGLATVAELHTRGPLAQVWRRPGGGREALLDMMSWHVSRFAPVAPPGTRIVRDHGRRDRAPRSLSNGVVWRGAREIVRCEGAFARLGAEERHAALSIGLSATQKALLTWIAQHPLLPARHLAIYLGLAERAVHALLDGQVRCRLVAVDTATRRRDREGSRYVLTTRGAGYLAARDGVPLARYLREGSIAAEGDRDGGGHSGRPGSRSMAQVRLADLRRHPEHTAGVHSFALALTGEVATRQAQGEDVRLLAWMSAVEAQEWFRYGGRAWHIWPDARFRLRADGIAYDLLLEWDRGLVRRRDYARKLACYAAYFGERGMPPGDAVRLVVVTTETAAERVQAALDTAARDAPRLRTASRLVPMAAVRERRIIPAIR